MDKSETDTLLFDERDHGLLLSFDYISKNTYNGYLSYMIANSKVGRYNTQKVQPIYQSLTAFSARYTGKSGLFLQGGTNSLSYDNTWVSISDFYGGYNYKIIDDVLMGYGQVGYYYNSPKSSNLKLALFYGYEARMEYKNPLVTSSITFSGDYGQTSQIRDLLGYLTLSHDFFLSYDPDDGAFAITPSDEIYLGSIRSTNVIQGKTVKQLIKKYGKKNYKSHLNEIYSVQNYNSGFGYLYDLAQLDFTYERKHWFTSAIFGLSMPDKGAPLPQTIAVNKFLFMVRFGYIFD